MRKATNIFLSLIFILYISSITVSIPLFNDKIINVILLFIYLIIDFISEIIMICHFFCINNLYRFIIGFHCFLLFYNFINIGVIMTIAIIKKRNKGNIVKVIKILIAYEIIFILKFYFHLIILLRFKSQANKNILEENKKEDDINEAIERTEKEMQEVIDENTRLKNENKKLNSIKKEQLRKCNNSNNNDNNSNLIYLKIEMICDYIKTNHDINITKNSLNKKFFLQIKDECGLIIDQKKYEEIALEFAKERISECLKCPLTKKIFTNPYITSEGQTFEKNEIMITLLESKKNPITNKKINSQELIENKLVLDICKILNENYDNFDKNNFDDIKNLLISKETNKYYENPVVDKNGETKESKTKDFKEKYRNKVIKDFIEKNMEILDDNFIFLDFEINSDKYDNDVIININNIDSSSRNKFIKKNKIIKDEDDNQKDNDNIYNIFTTEKINVSRKDP